MRLAGRRSRPRLALIYIHKEEELDDAARLHFAKHYVIMDVKLRLLDAMKKVVGVFRRQGHYAADSNALGKHPHGDVQLSGIGQLTENFR